ncbi:hypothetical protein PMZ80_011155 [Knufia obscura]|uniref:Methyltransferase n=1 Tax=Knufia obscura TaxID=1635080 RepID=A0ABR0R8M7_9EURO|nr:hypothetical protein PMZ80_011155 [Knufia obscura]
MGDTDQSSVVTSSILNTSVEVIDEDDRADDASVSGDSGFWDVESSTYTVASSIYDYEEAHGRTYHAFHRGQYLFPNDSAEIERMEVKYHAVRLALHDNLFFAPIKDPLSVLDVGTGAGAWCIDVADAHPNALVKGIDLSPIQPNNVPPNCVFEIADADDDWTFSQKFDLIHTRIMNDFSLKSWWHFFTEAYASLSVGGWVECQEFDWRRRSDDGTIEPDSRLEHWEDELLAGLKKVGLRDRCDPELVMQQMRDVGFINVHRKNFKLPIGPWAKDPTMKQAGLFGLVNLIDGIQGLSAKIFTELLGYGMAELELLLMECRQELRQKSVHSYYPVYVIMGQRPLLEQRM